jgi:hypothetical protein
MENIVENADLIGSSNRQGGLTPLNELDFRFQILAFSTMFSIIKWSKTPLAIG